jgi:hypothetical protein
MGGDYEDHEFYFDADRYQRVYTIHRACGVESMVLTLDDAKDFKETHVCKLVET